MADALKLIKQPTLVIGIESDGLFTIAEQEELASCIPDARLARIDSPEGHDAFLIQFAEVNLYILEFLREVLPDIMEKEVGDTDSSDAAAVAEGVVSEKRGGLVTEVDDITAW